MQSRYRNSKIKLEVKENENNRNDNNVIYHYEKLEDLRSMFFFNVEASHITCLLVYSMLLSVEVCLVDYLSFSEHYSIYLCSVLFKFIFPTTLQHVALLKFEVFGKVEARTKNKAYWKLHASRPRRRFITKRSRNHTLFFLNPK